MQTYEAPMLRRLGSVREITLGFDTLRQWEDETYLFGLRLPLPGSGDESGLS